MSSVLGRVLVPDGKICVSSVNGDLTAAALSPGGMLVFKNKHKKEVEFNHFHVSLTHAHLAILKATAQQHGIRLNEKLAPCSACSQAKGIRAAILHHTKAQWRVPMELIDIDTVGPYPGSLGGSRYLIKFVSSTSHL